MSNAEKRRHLRRTINYPAWIDLGDGTPLRECSLCDASQQGSQLTVAEPDQVPDRFTLALSADGSATRQCRVIWRAGKHIGVRFLKNPNMGMGISGRRLNLSGSPATGGEDQTGQADHAGMAVLETGQS
jgi:hypothetical protein